MNGSRDGRNDSQALWLFDYLCCQQRLACCAVLYVIVHDGENGLSLGFVCCE